MPDEPLSANKQRQPKQEHGNPGAPSLTMGKNAPKHKPAHDNTGQPSQKKHSLSRWLENAWQNYKFRQFREDPRVWLEVVVLLTLITYTYYACVQARSAIKAAGAAKDAADTARDSLTIGDRPWLEVGTDIGIFPMRPANPQEPTIPQFPFIPNHSYHLGVIAKNFGRNPALKTYVKYAWDWKELGQSLPTLDKVVIPVLPECQDTTPFWASASEAIFPTGVHEYDSNQALSFKTWVDKLQDGSAAYFVYGCARYKDSFNLNTSDFYQTNFCSYAAILGPGTIGWKTCYSGTGVR
jgi:hypothetical protein